MMLCSEICRYLETVKGYPFLYAVGDSAYVNELNELKQNGLKVLRVSDFCTREDRFPDYDAIIEQFRTLDIDYKDNRYVVVGLGESLALRGKDEAKKVLRRIKAITIGNARIVVLIRGISVCIQELLIEDPRLAAKNLICLSENLITNISIINNKIINTSSIVGIKNIVRCLEDGTSGSINVTTDISLDDSLFPVKVIDNAYEAMIRAFSQLRVDERCGSGEQWMHLLETYNQNPDYVKRFFSEYIDCENEIYEHVIGSSYKNWYYFLNLKIHAEKIKNQYLQYVVSETDDFGKLKENILIEIIKVPQSDQRFRAYYEERKKLIKCFPESEIAYFVNENQINPNSEIYNYTDNTELERRKIVDWVAHNGWHEFVADIYPKLGMYMKKFIFQYGTISDRLTEYFDQYKRLKLQNQITDDFMKLVYEYGRQYLYTKLQTRDSALGKIEDKKESYLYWIDALGVEYLSYISCLAYKRGLSIEIDIARSDLPTITLINKDFFEKWPGELKYKEEELDNIKHKEKGGFFYTDNKTPVHLVRELDVIDRAIDAAVSALALRKCKQFIITSDHGASRLAVIKEIENPHPTDTKGEHSGRCCKAYEEDDLQYIVKENGYFVRTDYERYAGSRMANVEVHGGASLEEIVIPIITLKLKSDYENDIRILNADQLVADRNEGTFVEIYISYVENKEDISLVVDGVRYKADGKGKNHYAFTLTEIRRQKKCKAELYDGSNLIGTLDLEIKGKTASVNSDFDDMF